MTKTYDRALRLLALRARSVHELRRKLLTGGEPAEEVEAAIERLVAAGLLDDAAFARLLARSHLAERGHAPRRIQQELARRGVDRLIADRAIAEVRTDPVRPVDGDFGRTAAVDLGEAIERLARKKLRSLASLDRPARARRLYAFLARRGYESDDIRRVIETVLPEGAPPDSA
jgi:regulatory protein